MIEHLCKNTVAETKAAAHGESFQEFEFTLKVRVESLSDLWQAAARHYAARADASAEDIEDMLGPREDPSAEDCLMALALPDFMAGCTMLDVSLNRELR